MPSIPRLVLVLGATGTQGGAIVPPLSAAGFQLSALVRDPASSRAQALHERRGVTLVKGDLFDRESLAHAFAEVEAVYAVTTPFEDGSDAEVRQGEAIIAAAEQVRLPWLVLASVASAQRALVPHFVSKAQIERRLAATDLSWTVVAPGYFYENVLGSLPSIRAGVLPLAVPADKPLHQVALRNLGELVAAVLKRPDEHLGVRIEVAGDAPTPASMAASFGAQYEPVPISDIEQRSPDLAAMFRFLSEQGYGIDVAAVRARYPEVDWIDFAAWARTVD